MFVYTHSGALEARQYVLSSVGTGMKDQTFSSRKAAEAAMQSYCSKRGIHVECVECGRHERAYEGGGVTFYINRA